MLDPIKLVVKKITEVFNEFALFFSSRHRPYDDNL